MADQEKRPEASRGGRSKQHWKRCERSEAKDTTTALRYASEVGNA